MTRTLPSVLLAALVTAHSGAAPSQPTDPADQPVARARSKADARQHQKVITALEPIPPAERTYEVHHLLGQAYSQVGRPHDARRSLQSALRLKPSSAPDHYQLGNLCFAAGKFALAVESYEQAARFGLDTPELHLRLANAYFQVGSYTGRIDDRLVIGGMPGRIRDGVYLIDPVPGRPGRFFVAGPTSAIFHLQRALDGGIDGPQVSLLLGDIWLRARRYEQAAEVYRELQGKVPDADRARYHQHFARSCLEIDDRDGYLAQVEQAIAQGGQGDDDALARAYREVAERYNADGELDEYIHYLGLAVRQAPASADLHYRLGNAYHEQGRKQDASRQWRITLELQPQHPDRMRMLEFVRDIAAESRAQSQTD